MHLIELGIELDEGEDLVEVINEQKDSIADCLRVLRLIQRELGDLFDQNRVFFSTEALKPRSRKTAIFKVEISFILTVGSRLELKFRSYQVLCTVWYRQSRWEVVVYDTNFVDRRKIAYNKQDEELAKTIYSLVTEIEGNWPLSSRGVIAREGARR